jgi:hypothetical protein
MGDKPTKPVRIKFSVLKEAFMIADFGATEGNSPISAVGTARSILNRMTRS